MRPRIEIDSDSGFCFGVTTAIEKAEAEMGEHPLLYCLGDIVHNEDEVQRLAAKGLKVISHEQIPTLAPGSRLLLRAHGEPPSTYAAAERHGVELIDATCPVVLQLQRRIKACWERQPRPQIVIYGKKGHAEVNGLVGQTEGNAIVIESKEQIGLIDPERPVALYSQTTKSMEGFNEIVQAIKEYLSPGLRFDYWCTICRQVARRVENLKRFAASHDVIIFVAGKKSSNGRVLFAHCVEANPRTYAVANARDLEAGWFSGVGSVGICGATSTPRWLMEEVQKQIEGICAQS